ncbi:MAG: hypothetical protein KDG89_08000, partial [Geminicoccaceae bacterium]|nr:hypothetical protein [Geminicoccaceae bacterium]
MARSAGVKVFVTRPMAGQGPSVRSAALRSSALSLAKARVEVGGAGRKEEQTHALGLDGRARLRAFVAGERVDDHDVPRRKQAKAAGT